MRSNAKKLMLVGLLTMLMSMTIGCGTTAETARPQVDADEVRAHLRASCVPVEGEEGFWRCEASALAQVEHSLVDLKWNIIECEQDNEYLSKKCVIQVELLEGELASCEHDPWCIGPIVAAAFAALGCLLGGVAF